MPSDPCLPYKNQTLTTRRANHPGFAVPVAEDRPTAATGFRPSIALGRTVRFIAVEGRKLVDKSELMRAELRDELWEVARVASLITALSVLGVGLAIALVGA